MFGPVGSQIMSIFKLLSPEEIDSYIVREGVNKVEGSMAAGGEQLSFNSAHTQDGNTEDKDEKLDTDSKAEIIPISEFQKKEVMGESASGETQANAEVKDIRESNPEVPTPSENVRGSSVLESMGILSAATLKKQEMERLEAERKKRDSATVFLLKERQKMRDSKKRLIEQQAISTYNKKSNEDYAATNNDEDEEISADSRGILVNKTQY